MKKKKLKTFVFIKIILYLCVVKFKFLIKMVSEQRIEKNYELFFSKLKELGIDTSFLEKKFGEKIKTAVFNTTSQEGSLLDTILRVLTPNAIKSSELIKNNEEIFNKISLVKVCLLGHISKCEMFQKGRREGTYDYAPYPYGMKMGLRSVALCAECGISLSAEEIEAMTVLDRETEDQAKYFSSPLASLYKIANELTFLQLKVIK